VLTAHPTEVQRKSILDAERAIAQLLAARDEIKMRAAFFENKKDALLPGELAANEAQMRARVMQLWQTRLLRFKTHGCRRDRERAELLRVHFLREIPKLYANLEQAGRKTSGTQFPAHGPVDWWRPRRQPQRQRPDTGPTHCVVRPKWRCATT
jgi:phosphoenolpyruvate carboxylase